MSTHADVVHIHADGSFDRKLRLAGLGVYLKRGLSKDDEIISGSICGSSVEAEYLAIELALKTALKRGYANLVIFNDCQSVIDTLSTQANLDTAIHSKYFCKILGLSLAFNSVDFKYIAREFNCAHVLSKEGLYSIKGGNKVASRDS